MKKHILSVSEKELEEFIVTCGGKKFVTKQIFNWLYNKQELDLIKYTNIKDDIKQKLTNEYSFNLPTIVAAQKSTDSSTKLLLKLEDGHEIEMVIMPSENRVTLCASTQVGCKMHCSFCETGKQGFTRNLSQGEIIAQLLIANKQLKEVYNTEQHITNIVFMGMGEPLDNYTEVVEAVKIILNQDYFGLSKHKVTISTVGIPDKIRQLGKEVELRLAISLHAPTNEERNKLIPMNKAWPLEELKAALLDYPKGRHGITFEYIMIKNVNDSINHAKKLVKFLHGLKAKVNLIPYNESEGNEFQKSPEENLINFSKYLSERSIPAPIRYSRGQDILAACGQLKTQKNR